MVTRWTVASFCLFAVACGPPPRPVERAPVVLPVKITQFYASPPRVATGEAALLCYGVESAATLKLDPPVESMHPAIARCFEVRPTATTTYELVATGKAGDRAASKVTVVVGAGRVRFTDLVVSAQEVAKGQPVSFCFKAANAVSVKGGPGSFQKGGLAAGDCLLDSPKETTTYRLTVTGADGGSDSESITVRVKP